MNGATQHDTSMSTTHIAPAPEWDIERVYTAYRTAMYSYLFSLLDNPEQAEDCTQETFLRAYRALAAMREPLHMTAWLYQIAQNVATDVLRRRRLIHWQSLETQAYETVEFIGDQEDEPEARYSGTNASVRATLNRIEPKYRQALLLYYECGLTYAEIADTLHVAPTGMKMFLTRARRQFRDQYNVVREEDEG